MVLRLVCLVICQYIVQISRVDFKGYNQQIIMPIPLFPSLNPPLIDPLWFNVDQPVNDEEEVTKLEQEHQIWNANIQSKDFQLIPIGKTSTDNVDIDEEEDDDAADDGDDDDDDDESDTNDEEEEEEMEMDVSNDRPSSVDINIQLQNNPRPGHGVR